MKRMLTTLAIAAAVIAAPAAYAATIDFEGQFEEGGLMIFELRKHDGKKHVRDFAWGKGVPMSCDDGDFINANGSFGDPIRVRGGRFQATRETAENTATVKGEIVNAHKFKGTLRQSGEIAGHPGCHTGLLHWKATDLDV